MNASSGVIGSASETADLLFVQMKSDKESTILCSYAVATILSQGSSQKVGYGFYVDQGESLTRNLTIYAEDLYLQGGSQYTFPGKKVTIVARRIFTLGDQPAVIQVNGMDGLDQKDKANDGSSCGKKGDDAGDALKGRNGTDAGSISLFVWGEGKLSLSLQANGGKGGKGGAGGNGAKGCGGRDETRNNRNGDKGGDGGKGGDGAAGGNGGKGGQIVLNYVEEVLQRPTTSVIGGAFGKGGDKGKRGDGGDGGKNGPITGEKCHSGGMHEGIICVPYTNDGGKQPDGAKGDKGAPGTDGTKGAEGSAGTTSFQPSNYATKVNLSHFSAIVRRLEFYYLTAVSVGPLKKIDPKDAGVVAFNETFAWISKVLAASQDKSFDRLKGRLSNLKRKIGSGLDYYSNRFNAIPRINWSLIEFNSYIRDFIDLYNQYRFFIKYLDGYESKKDRIESSSELFYQFLEKTKKTSKEDGAQIEQLRTKIVVAKQEEDKRRKLLEEKIESLRAKIENVLSCGSKFALDILSTTLLFSGEFTGLAGPALGAFLGESSRELAKEKDQDTFYVNGLIGIEDDVDRLSQAVKTAAEAKDAKVYLAIERSKFRQFCYKHLGQFLEAQEVQSAFDDYLDQVEEKIDLIAQHDTLLLDYNQRLLEIDDLKSRINDIKAHMSELNVPHLTEMADFYADTLKHATLSTLFKLYSFSRAVNCLTLKPSRALESLTQIQQFGEVNSFAMLAASGILKDELEVFNTTLATKRVAKQTVEIKLSGDKRFPQLVSSLARRKCFTVDFDPGDSNELKNKADVRLNTIEVYLIGATTGNKVVDLKICLQETFQIVDPSGKSYRFVLMSEGKKNVVDFPYSYAYTDPKNAATYNAKSESLALQSEFVYSTDKRFSTSLISPFGRWKIEVLSTADTSGGSVILNTVTEIMFKMNVSYRNPN